MTDRLTQSELLRLSPAMRAVLQAAESVRGRLTATAERRRSRTVAALRARGLVEDATNRLTPKGIDARERLAAVGVEPALEAAAPVASATPFDKPKRRRISTRERAAIFQGAGGLCHICGGRIQAGEAWEVEHIVPLAMGGADEAANLRPAHRKCHRAKTSADARRIAKSRRLYAKHHGIAERRSRFATSKRGPFKQRLDGTIERREERG